MHDDLRKVQISRRKTGHAVSPAQAVPPHVPTKTWMARGEAQPTHAARVDQHRLWRRPRLLLGHRRPPEVAGPVAAQRLERREPPPARLALELLVRTPPPATTGLIRWWGRRAGSMIILLDTAAGAVGRR